MIHIIMDYLMKHPGIPWIISWSILGYTGLSHDQYLDTLDYPMIHSVFTLDYLMIHPGIPWIISWSIQCDTLAYLMIHPGRQCIIPLKNSGIPWEFSHDPSWDTLLSLRHQRDIRISYWHMQVRSQITPEPYPWTSAYDLRQVNR